jgi:hypothetical protein
MYTQIENPKEKRSRAVANFVVQNKSRTGPGFWAVDNRPEAVTQRKHQAVCANSPGLKQSIQLTASDVIQKVKTKIVAGVTVTTQDNGSFPTWDMSNERWHIHWGATEKKGQQYHCVTKEASKKLHYFFTLDAGVITSKSSGQKGQKKFENLPNDVQNFVRNNIRSL